MAENKHRELELVGKNLNDAEGSVLKLHKWYLKESERMGYQFAITFYYRDKTESTLERTTTTIYKRKNLHFVFEYWEELFFSVPGTKTIIVLHGELSRLFDFKEMDVNLMKCYEL